MRPDGYTAVVCAARGCGLLDEATVAGRLVDAVRAAVAASGHGVMVTTGCLVGACGSRPAAPVLLVQPCDERRRPTRPALRIGTLRTSVDVDAVSAWLRAGRLDPALLPVHLVVPHRRAGVHGP